MNYASRLVSTQKASRPKGERLLKRIWRPRSEGQALLRRDHFLWRCGRDFLEPRKRAQTRWFRFAGAATGDGQEGEYGSARRKKNADHGLEVKSFGDLERRMPERVGGQPAPEINWEGRPRPGSQPYLAGAT